MYSKLKWMTFSIYSREGHTDGYMWTEILHQSDLITSKENHLDYRHYYISTSLGGDGRRRRTSSKFRREAYTMGDLTLITYIGDEKEAAMPSSHASQGQHNSLTQIVSLQKEPFLGRNWRGLVIQIPYERAGYIECLIIFFLSRDFPNAPNAVLRKTVVVVIDFVLLLQNVIKIRNLHQ